MSLADFKSRLASAGYPAHAAAVAKLPSDPLGTLRKTTLPAQARAQCPTTDVLAACDVLERAGTKPAAQALLTALLSAEGKPGCPAYVTVSGTGDDGKPFSYQSVPLNELCSAVAWAVAESADPVRAAQHAASAVASLGGTKVAAAVAQLDVEAAKEAAVAADPLADSEP